MQFDLFALSCIAAGACACVLSGWKSKIFRSQSEPMRILNFLILKFFVGSMVPSGVLMMVMPIFPGAITRIPMAPLYIFFAGGVVFVIAMLAIFHNSVGNEIS